MRKKVIAGNWKMYKTRDDALDFIYQVNTQVPEREDVETVIFAPSIYLRSLVKRQEKLRIGIQNMHYLDEGAYTGEISLPMVKNLGIQYVLIGHSERRKYYNESDSDVNLKLLKVLQTDLIPMVCIGEDLEIREKGETTEFVGEQVKRAFEKVTAKDAKKVILAYEPIWAIGTGKTATPFQANETISEIRQTIFELYGKEVSEEIRILYGGSVKTSNINDLLEQPEIDGALIGGASLVPSDFILLANAGKK